MATALSNLGTWSERAAFCCLALTISVILCSLVLFNVDPANNSMANSDDVIRGYLLLNFFFYSNSIFLLISIIYLSSDFAYSRAQTEKSRKDLALRLLMFLLALFLSIFHSIATAFQMLPTIIVNCVDAGWINFAANSLALPSACTQSCSVPVWWVSVTGLLLLTIIAGLVLANLLLAALHHKRAKE